MQFEFGYVSAFSNVQCVRTIKTLSFACWDVIGETPTPPVIPYDKKMENKRKRMVKAIDDYYDV